MFHPNIARFASTIKCNIITVKKQHYLPGCGGGLVVIGGRGVCGGNGGLGPLPSSPVYEIKCNY